MSKRLTALSVENAKPGTSRREISDNGSGLFLVVQPSGHKSFAVRFRVNGIPKKLTLPAGLSLHDARTQAHAAIAEAKRGNDPTKAKRVAQQQRRIAAANTFEATALLYLDSERVKKLRTVDQYRDMLTRLVFPVIGDKPIADLKRSHYNALLDQIEKRGAVRADRTLSVIWQVLKFHARRDDDYVIPLIPGMSRTSPTERARSRVLTDDEIRKVWKVGHPLINFLLLTCARRDEVASMPWREIKDGIWTLPAHRNNKPKVRFDLVRPLSKAAIALLPPRGNDDEYVFGHVPDRPFGSFARMKRRVDAASGVTGWRLHDLRRTGRSLLSRAGINTDVAELCLGHTLKGVRATYDRYSYIDEKRQALEALAHQIELIVNPPRDNVRQLKRKRA
jgi:integrase